jgi:biotin operon repressor
MKGLPKLSGLSEGEKEALWKELQELRKKGVKKTRRQAGTPVSRHRKDLRRIPRE